MNLLTTNDEEENEDYDLDEDREPLVPVSPHKTGGAEVEVPVPSSYNTDEVIINWNNIQPINSNIITYTFNNLDWTATSVND